MSEPSVELFYRPRGATAWLRHALTPEAYYEPDEAGRAWNSVPRFDHAAEYLPIPAAQLEQTVLRLRDRRGAVRCTIREVFWNEGQNRLIHRTGDNGSLFILALRTGPAPQDLQIIRYDTTRPHDSILEHFVHFGGPTGPSETLVSAIIPDLAPDEPMNR